MKKLMLCLFTGVLSLLSGCLITIPEDDSTPPSAVLLVVFGNTCKILTPDSASTHCELTLDDSIKFSIIGTDQDGGIKSVCLSGGITVSSVQGRLGNRKQMSIFASDSDDKNPGDIGWDMRVKTQAFYMADLAQSRPQGYRLTGIEGSLSGTVGNYNRGVTRTPSFSFSLKK